MPQICDMGQDRLLLVRKVCWRLFSPWKIRRLRPVLNPRTWVPKASTEAAYDASVVWNGIFIPFKSYMEFEMASIVSIQSSSCSYHVVGTFVFSCWSLVPKFAGSNPTEAIRFFRAKKKIPQPALLRRWNKSRLVPCRKFVACKRTLKVALPRYFQAKFTGHFSPNSSTFHC
jgi:hypothetical protein